MRSSSQGERKERGLAEYHISADRVVACWLIKDYILAGGLKISLDIKSWFAVVGFSISDTILVLLSPF